MEGLTQARGRGYGRPPNGRSGVRRRGEITESLEMSDSRHCEERSNEAIQGPQPGCPALLRFARNYGKDSWRTYFAASPYVATSLMSTPKVPVAPISWPSLENCHIRLFAARLAEV